MAKKRRRSLIDKPKLHRTPAPAPSRRPTIPAVEDDDADPMSSWNEAMETADAVASPAAADDGPADLPEHPDPTDAPPIPETIEAADDHDGFEQIPGVSDADDFDLFGSPPAEDEAAEPIPDSPPVLGVPDVDGEVDKGEEDVATVDDVDEPSVDPDGTPADPTEAESAIAAMLASSLDEDAPEASEEAVQERPSTLIPDDDANPVVIRNLPSDFQDADEALAANTGELAFFDSGDDLAAGGDDDDDPMVAVAPTPGRYNRQTMMATGAAIGFVTLAVLVFMGVMSSMREPLSSETPVQVAPAPEPPPKPEPPPPPPEPEVLEEEPIEEEVVEEEVATAAAPRPRPRPQPEPEPEPVASAPKPVPEPVVAPEPAPEPDDDKKGLRGIFGKKKKNK